MTDEQKEQLRANLEKARAARAAKRAEAETAPIMEPIAHEGVVEPMIEVDPEPVPPEPADGFERFLAAQDEETRSVLSDMDLRVIYEAEMKRVAEEKREAVRKSAKARALRFARLNAGLLTPEQLETAALADRLSRKVSWTVNMPEAGNSGTLIDEGVRIDGQLRRHGEQVTGTLAEYMSYREIEWRAHQAELDFQGKGRLSRQRQRMLPDANRVQMV